MAVFYRRICSDVIVLYLQLITAGGLIDLEGDMDWDLLSKKLRELGVTGISLQFLQLADWAVNTIFNAAQGLMRKYPETSIFRQKMVMQQKNSSKMSTCNVAAVAAGAVAVAAYALMFLKFT